LKYIVSVVGDVTSTRYRTLEVYADTVEAAEDKAETMFVQASRKSKHFVKMGDNIRVVSIEAVQE